VNYRNSNAVLSTGSVWTPPARGCSVLITEDYDLFGNNVNGEEGIYLKTDKNSGKHLVYFEKFSEWGEFSDESVLFEAPNHIPPMNQEFIDRVTEMIITFET